MSVENLYICNLITILLEESRSATSRLTVLKGQKNVPKGACDKYNLHA